MDGAPDRQDQADEDEHRHDRHVEDADHDEAEDPDLARDAPLAAGWMHEETIVSDVHLIHWDDAEAQERLARLRDAGHRAVRARMESKSLRAWSDDPPDAIVIDLSRLPSHGRQAAQAIRERKSTRTIPIVFVDGDPEKVAKTRELLPDAVYTTWARIGGALRGAIAKRPKNPVVPSSRSEGYSRTPLVKKLGIAPGAAVALVGAPAGIEKTIGDLPEGAKLVRKARGPTEMVLWFVKSKAELTKGIRKVARDFTGKSGLWIAWPKKTSGIATDVSETEVRAIALAAGLVDFKVCAIDATWSGLRFSRRSAT